MRLWLSEAERRPDPAPARTDARKALAVGTAAWLVVLIGCLVAQSALDANGFGWFTAAAAIGLGLGVIGLVVVQLRRRRDRRSED
jgi:hypothetical protein